MHENLLVRGSALQHLERQGVLGGMTDRAASTLTGEQNLRMRSIDAVDFAFKNILRRERFIKPYD